MPEVELGDRVRDKIGGFTGIATARTIYLESCDQIFVRPEKLDKEGKKLEGHWFDAPWLEVVQKSVHKPIAVVEREGRRISGGGDRPHPEG